MAKPSEICTVLDCETQATAKGLCRMHRGRLERIGSFDLPMKPATHKHNYRVVYDKTHPLASLKRGTVPEHRHVYYNKTGGKPDKCCWCGLRLKWYARLHRRDWPEDYLVVDHLDFDKKNNNETNLVPSCSSCNDGRRYNSTKIWEAVRHEISVSLGSPLRI